MSARQIRIVKVGGSLFDLPDLADRLRQWLSRQSPAHHVLLAGGGSLVDEVRHWHALRPLDEAAAHWMCVDLLTVSAHLLNARLPEIPLIEDDRLLCQRVGERDCTVFVPATWIRHGEPKLPGTRLPQTWEVTSDSISARLAIALGADELVLMKSILPEKDSDGGIQAFSAAGYVDPMMGRIAAELPPVRFVNLRADSLPELVLNALGSNP
jgi:aspartokinase-like uncharacterized kinase